MSPSFFFQSVTFLTDSNKESMSVPNNANTFLPPSPVTPPFLLIGNITQAYRAVITVTETNTYVAGQVIHLNVPASYGMSQADQLMTEILSINGLDFTTNLDTTLFDPFVVPADYEEKPASLAPAGSRNLYNTSTVPFHSVGNFGN